MPDETLDQQWAAMTAMPSAQREGRMIELCRTLAAMDDGPRIETMTGMVRAEYELADAELHAFTVNRLRAWIAIEQEDREAATRLARGYDAVFQGLPGAMAMRRASIVQGVARNELTAEEVEMLFLLIPSLVQHVPRVRQDALTSRPHSASAPERKKPWWRFW